MKCLHFSAHSTACVVYYKNGHKAHRCFVPSSKDGIESSEKPAVGAGDFTESSAQHEVAAVLLKC